MSKFEIIHQGGHHDVWCDGDDHRITEGGYVWQLTSPMENRIGSRLYQCDCGRWGGRNVKNLAMEVIGRNKNAN